MSAPPYYLSNSTATGSAASPTTAPAEVHASAGTLVLRFDIAIAVLFGLFALCRCPRALARLFYWKELSNGHVLRHVSQRRPTFVVQSSTIDQPTNDAATGDSHTLYSHSLAPLAKEKEEEKEVQPSYPPHVASCVSWLRPLMAPLSWRVSSGFSISQWLVLAVYFIILLFPSFFRSNPFTDPIRTGYVAMCQIPIVFALAAKNGVVGNVLGLGYEKLNFIHRFVGRLIVLAVNIHSFGYFYKWTLQGSFVELMKTHNARWGLVGLLCVDSLVFFSTTFWRRKAYNVFLCTHIISFILFIPAVWFHKPTMIPYTLAGLGIYSLDLLLRVIKTRFCQATLRPLPEFGVTRVEVPQINAGWRAGQHVRVRVMSSGMGWWRWTEVHPFTIASVSGGNEGLVLMCKKTGTWTNRLYEIAKARGYLEAEFGRKVTLMIEGPYGGPGHAIFASYSAAVFIVGGIGITFAISAIQEIIQKDLEGASRVKVIELIWVVQDPQSLNPLLPLFTKMIQDSLFATVKISIYYTRPPRGKIPFSVDFFHPALSLSPGRPHIPKVFDAVISRAVSLGSGTKDSERITGLLVVVCGPVALADDVSRAVGRVTPRRRDQVGGIEVHEEVFGW